MSHLFQKVPDRIQRQNQNQQRPNVFGPGYPSPPPPLCFQTFRNRRCEWRAVRVCMGLSCMV